jgi:hypothetical protein
VNPNFFEMKTIVPSMKVLLVIFLTTTLKFAFADDDHGSSNDHLAFSNPSLVSGTQLSLGAVYRFDNVMSNVYALVRIDSLVNGAQVKKIDDDSRGAGYTDAFQPEITIPGDSYNRLHEAYAVFKITFYSSLTNGLTTLESVGATALDIDGNINLKEFAELNMDGGTAKYMSITPDISVFSLLDILLGRLKFRADNILGIERDGIDTSSMANMFSVSNSDVNSFKIKYGAKSTLKNSTDRQFSLYMKGFQYPSEITLPVKLVDFSAKYDQTKVSLSWKSTQEINFNYYELEHSTDGNTFTTTSIVFGAGENGNGAEYNYADKSFTNKKGGLIYYRLKMVDIDNKFTYSAVRVVRLGEENASLTINSFPNPVVDDLRITLPSSWQSKKVNIQVYNSNGQLVNHLNVSNSSQIETVSMNDFQKGVYFIKATCGNQTASQQIIKN